MMFRPLPFMTICVVLALGVLAMLGGWQWQRYAEKLDRNDAIISWTELDAGTLVEDGVFYQSTVFGGRAAWMELLAVDVGATSVLVTNGVVFSIAPPDTPLYDELASTLRFAEGVFRTPSKAGVFTPEADIPNRLIYAIDPDALGAALGRPLRAEVFEPRTILARDETGQAVLDNPRADPVLADPLPPARHLGYALTWWGIAAGLIAIYFIYHMKAGRLTFGERS